MPTISDHGMAGERHRQFSSNHHSPLLFSSEDRTAAIRGLVGRDHSEPGGHRHTFLAESCHRGLAARHHKLLLHFDLQPPSPWVPMQGYACLGYAHQLLQSSQGPVQPFCCIRNRCWVGKKRAEANICRSFPPTSRSELRQHPCAWGQDYLVHKASLSPVQPCGVSINLQNGVNCQVTVRIITCVLYILYSVLKMTF